MKLKKVLLVLSITLMLLVIFGLTAYAGCTSIMVGKDASVDGSVITSHTCDGWYDSGLVVIPAADYKPGEMAPVYIKKLHQDREAVTKIGEIPEVPHTYKYFWVGYPCANEHQVLIGEDTITGEPVLQCGPEAIMWIEQLEIFALQRAKTAREAIKIMGELAVEYGYADRGENLTVSDPNEAWSFEIYGVGPLWSPNSGKPGAVWCAQRVPDDHIFVSPNLSRIDQINPSDTENFIVCENYMETAIELGLYDPASDKPFSWRVAYGALYRSNSRQGRWPRLWRAFNLLAPSAAPEVRSDKKWLLDQTPNYPFSVKPDKKVSVQDVYAVFTDTNEGTEYDNTGDPAWYIKTKDGFVKSPLATPHTTKDIAQLLNLEYFRPGGSWGNSYHFVSQARSWLPNEIGGIFWFGYDNPHNSLLVPVWVGVNDVAPRWKVADRTKLNRDCAWWAFGLVDDQVNTRYGVLKPLLDEVRVPLQQELFSKQSEIEQEALKLYQTDPETAKEFLTDYTISTMNQAEQTYWEVLDKLYYEVHNNTKGGTFYLHP